MANGLFTTIDPLYGLDKLNIPGVSKIPGAESFRHAHRHGPWIAGRSRGGRRAREERASPGK